MAKNQPTIDARSWTDGLLIFVAEETNAPQCHFL
jgi:hypothetical protein